MYTPPHNPNGLASARPSNRTYLLEAEIDAHKESSSSPPALLHRFLSRTLFLVSGTFFSTHCPHLLVVLLTHAQVTVVAAFTVAFVAGSWKMTVVLSGVLPLLCIASFIQMRELRQNTDKMQDSIAKVREAKQACSSHGPYCARRVLGLATES